jgi:hypothetical protein
VLNVEDDEDVDDDATIADESTPRVRGGRKGKGKAKAGSSSGMSEQRMRELEAKARGIAGEVWEHAEQIRQLREASYPPQ